MVHIKTKEGASLWIALLAAAIVAVGMTLLDVAWWITLCTSAGFPNGIDQVLPRRRIFPAGDRKTILVREVSLAVGEGDQRNADFLIVQFGDSDRFVFSEGPKRRQEGGEHRDGSDPAIERDPHLREKKLG